MDVGRFSPVGRITVMSGVSQGGLVATFGRFVNLFRLLRGTNRRGFLQVMYQLMVHVYFYLGHVHVKSVSGIRDRLVRVVNARRVDRDLVDASFSNLF